MKRKKSRFIIYIINVVLVLVILLAGFSVYKNVVYSPLVVVGSSMYPTLKNGDFGYANKTKSAIKHIKRGDIILFNPTTDLDSIYIKRVIALPNDEFYLNSKTGDITINGELFNQDFLEEGVKEKTCSSSRKYYYADSLITLGEGEYFVLGDNRSVSLDSAHGIGFAKQENIISILDVILATCDMKNYASDDEHSALNVCSYKNRHYKSINNWKFF